MKGHLTQKNKLVFESEGFIAHFPANIFLLAVYFVFKTNFHRPDTSDSCNITIRKCSQVLINLFAYIKTCNQTRKYKSRVSRDKVPPSECHDSY